MDHCRRHTTAATADHSSCNKINYTSGSWCTRSYFRCSCSCFGAIQSDILPHAVTPYKCLILVAECINASHTCSLPGLSLLGYSADSGYAGIMLLRSTQSVERTYVVHPRPIIPLYDKMLAAAMHAFGYCAVGRGNKFLAQLRYC